MLEQRLILGSQNFKPSSQTTPINKVVLSASEREKLNGLKVVCPEYKLMSGYLCSFNHFFLLFVITTLHFNLWQGCWCEWKAEIF